MIKEFSVHPKPQNSNSKIAVLIAVAVACLGFVSYFLVDRYQGIIGLFALCSLTTAILIYTKYISPEFYYDIKLEDDNTFLFVVRQVIGKRHTTLCRIDMADIISVTKETKKERRSHKSESNVRKYIYAPTLFPDKTFRITTKSRYESAEIIIEGTDEFCQMLSEYSKEARELRLLDEE